MLFTISSNGETDHAKFSNYFNDSCIIKPNSFICLVAASVVEDLNNTIITMPANTTLTLRFDPLNQVTLTINTEAREYSIRELKDRLNEMFSNTQAFYINRAFICKVRVDPNDPGKLQLLFTYYTPAAANLPDQNYLKYVYPGNTGNLANEPQQNLNYPCFPNNTATYANAFNNPLPVKGFNENWMRVVWDSLPGGQSNAVQPSGNNNYVINGVTYGYGMIRDTNRESFHIALNPGENSDNFDLQDQLNVSQFTIGGCPNPVNANNTHQYNMAIGPSVHDIGTNQYTDGPIPGMVGYDARVLEMKWRGDGRLTLDVRNTVTDNLDQTYNQLFNIGDMYRLSNSLSNVFPRDLDNCYMPLISRYDYDGQVYWLCGSVNTTGGTYGTALVYNTKIVHYNPGINFIYKNAARTVDDTLLSVDWISGTTRLSMNNCFAGCWGGQGFSNGSRVNNTTPMYRDNGLNEAIDTVASYANDALEYLQHLPILRRVDTTTPEPNTPNSSKKQHIALRNYNTSLQTFLPTAVSVLVYFMNDSAVVTLPNSFQMTICGGRQTLAITKGPVIKAALGSLAAYDFEVFDDAGVATQIILNDAGAARPNLQYNTWYHIFYGDDGAGNFQFELADIVANSRYTISTGGGVATLTSGRLMNIEALGAADTTMTLNGADNYFFGHICQFRFFVRPRNGVNNVTDWNNIRDNLNISYTSGQKEPVSIMKPTETDIQMPANFTNYCCMPDINTAVTNTPVFYAEAVTDINFAGTGYGAFDDVMWLQNVKSPYNVRNKLPFNEAITGYGVGMTDINQLHLAIAFEDYDNANTRVVEQVLPNFLTGPDNPWFDEPAEVNNIALEDEVFNVEVTNLPHRSFNGKNHSYDKTIYQLPVETTSKEIQGVKITEHSAEQRVWLPLNNPGEIPIKKLDIQISKEDGRKADNLQPDTHVVLQIEQREDIL